MSFYMIPNILRPTKNYRKCIGMNKFQNLFPMIDKVLIRMSLVDVNVLAFIISLFTNVKKCHWIAMIY